MSVELKCKGCGKYMGVLRDASVRNGMVVYCAVCNNHHLKPEPTLPPNDSVPDFLRQVFGMR